jgi:hypothetical protein
MFSGQRNPAQSAGIIVLVVLLVRFGPGLIKQDLAFFQDRFMKMGKADVETALLRYPLRVSRGPVRDISCTEYGIDWEYVCVFRTGGPESKQYYKVGVNAGHSRLTAVTIPVDVTARAMTQ